MRKTHGLFSWRSILKAFLKIRPTKILISLFILTLRYVISLSYTQNVLFFHWLHCKSISFITAASYIHRVWIYSITFKCKVDVNENPGPKPNSCDILSICYWNLNSIPAQNLMNLSLLHAYISAKDLLRDLLRLKYSSDDNNLEVPEHNWVRAVNSINAKRGDVCIYYHNSLPLKLIYIQF